jgi:hypothetical protein
MVCLASPVSELIHTAEFKSLLDYRERLENFATSWDTSTHRLWDLWDIMNSFDVSSLVWILHELSQGETVFLMNKILGRGSQKPESCGEKALKKGGTALDSAEVLFRHYDIGDCLKAVQTAKERWADSLLDVSSAAEILHRVQTDIVDSLQAKMFLRISDDRTEFLDKEKLFGDQVYDAFASARADIKEAGNCLTAECNTAAVFHLMRASEVALRALARDRNVSFANKPLDQQEWGTILGALEGKLNDLRLADGKNWQRHEVKDAQVQFYNDTVQEFRAFNEAWRRHISHANPRAFYDHDEAGNVMKHVKLFMQKLAIKISEANVTPEFWISV